MAEKTKKGLMTGIVAAAALAGLAAGAVAVYVTNRPSGNDQQATACGPALERAQAVGEAATGHVAAMLAASEATSLTALAFNGPGGEAMTLADFEGKTLLLNLWATWCAPCRAEMPALDKLQRERGGSDFEVVAVNIDRGAEDKPRRFLDEIGVETLAFYRDETMGVFNDLKSRALAIGLPVTILIDDKGCMLANMNGPAEWASEDAFRLIDVALKKG